MLRRFLTILSIVFLALLPCAASSAYGGGTQAERFPQMLAAQDLKMIAEKAITDEFAALGETRRHEVRFIRCVDVRLPAGPVTTRAYLPTSLRYEGRMPVKVEIYLGDKLYRTVTAYFSVRLYDTVLVAKRNISVDDTIGEGDVALKEIEADGNETYIKSIGDIAGRVPSRLIKAGQPLTDNFFQQPMAIVSGSQVKILGHYGSVTVSAMGRAMQRGRIGQSIRVKNLTSGKVLFAKVVDSETVSIGEERPRTVSTPAPTPVEGAQSEGDAGTDAMAEPAAGAQ